MSTYAQVTDCQSYSSVLAAADGATLTEQLTAAEKDIDSLFLGRNLVSATGRRWDVTDVNIPTTVVQGLKDATCAQVEYRVTLGPQFFIKAQYTDVKGPDFTTKGKLPRVGPKAHEELLVSGCIPSQTKSTI